MKDIIFKIIVVFLSPVYFLIFVLKKAGEFVLEAGELVLELAQPFSEDIQDIIENMVDFWRKIFRIKGD